MKILVIKRDKIGDLLLTTPMLAHLRRSRRSARSCHADPIAADALTLRPVRTRR